MAFPVATDGDGDGAFLRQVPAIPAFSSNRPFKTHIAPLEILSEATEETDAGFVSEDTEYSLCTSPTCTKGSSSDEGAKLLVQPFGSSEKLASLYGNKAKASASKAGASNVQQISQSSAIKAAAEKGGSKVSFQAKNYERFAIKRSSMQMQRQMAEVFPAEAAARRSGSGTSMANYGKPRVDADMQLPLQCANLSHVEALSSNRCIPSMSSRAAHFLHRHCSHALLKLRGIIQPHQEGDATEDDGVLVQGNCCRADASMDDVNEMKALLNTINQNLKMLETRGKAHPQLLSLKLAPVYFTT